MLGHNQGIESNKNQCIKLKKMHKSNTSSFLVNDVKIPIFWIQFTTDNNN